MEKPEARERGNRTSFGRVRIGIEVAYGIHEMRYGELMELLGPDLQVPFSPGDRISLLERKVRSM
jgi:hypothetical protein